MKNFVLGFLLGMAVMTAGAGLAQVGSSGSTFSYGDGNITTFTDPKTGQGGYLFPYPDSGVVGGTGSVGSSFTYPDSGVTSYTFGNPCSR